ncbi:MAG: isoprenyl transferase [Tetragenococcus halophilus]|uniref:isoprenyl transferase n=1 Tax=Tetragenococcus halophilus TaxID=51669 RepID=UPI001F316DC6|nr:isoprenyl transferase [Tetragenococcus halophilus]MCF1602375.1 isoprenyl transferase [Tetragenococcus halophilus]MCF1676352.1 isoprenyl transferase [Tetragenococcus halophilus]MCO8291956.1 isoprenyl transferase [Tetragenococcus halophilus]MCO8296365.1 isoprenyl transferase [Tetragenococcus halophilus]MDN6128241.1 isoprenyl transferase [Tetragenococcus halophilus]
MLRFFPEKNKTFQEEQEYTFDSALPVPKHIAIIMDGNGRWAQNRRLPRVAGHKEGMETVKKITKHASYLGVKVLTLYAFSTENWKRPEEEVNFLMQLPVDFFDTFVPELMKENVRVNVMGEYDVLPAHTQDAINRAVKQTSENTGMILNFALNYGSRAEMVSAVKNIATDISAKNIEVEQIDDDFIADYLMTGFLPKEIRDPEVLIRTSGEERISNFLLWQIAYSELLFTKELWPDYSEASFENSIAIFQHRNRRFGGLKNKEENK